MTAEQFHNDVFPLKHPLYRFARRMLKSTADAEDIVQEVMVRLWIRREKLESYRNLEAFAMTITKNLCLDKMKRKGYRTDALTDNNIPQGVPSPYTVVETSDSMQLVQELMDQLPEQQRMIIHLRDVEGYPYDQIGEILDMTENAIRVNLSRARKKIRDGLSKLYTYEFTRN
jgi:RNA polymerase sigma-70 factor (ECF subfamily)